MQMTTAEKIDQPVALPAEAEMILSALDAGQARSRQNRRETLRIQYRIGAQLHLFSDAPGTAPREVYTRDVGPKSLGFISQARLPLGYGGILELVAPDGLSMRIHCTILRCREAAPGWYEGAVYFNREQACFQR